MRQQHRLQGYLKAMVRHSRFRRCASLKPLASDALTLNPLPATFLRGGTSKCIFINSAHLPADKRLWKPIFQGIMGSPDPLFRRQINGMGGGISSLSKICVVGPPSAEALAKCRRQEEEQGIGNVDPIDVEYTFVQVGVKDGVIDFSGNCGNISAMVGVFALDEGILRMPSQISKEGAKSQVHGGYLRTATVKSFNTNTEKLISTTFPVATFSHDLSGALDEAVRPILDLPQTTIAGVHGAASQITVEFSDPAGARTGKLLPTGQTITVLPISLPCGTTVPVSVSLVDATSPAVFMDYRQLTDLGIPVSEYISGKQPAVDHVTEVLQSIRQAGATAMGLDPATQSQPKAVILSRPSDHPAPPSELNTDSGAPDIVVHTMAMGVLHNTIPITVALCVGVAAKIEGTHAWKIVRAMNTGGGPKEEEDASLVRIQHPGGIVDVSVDMTPDGVIKSAQAVRTGRRLMAGSVYW